MRCIRSCDALHEINVPCVWTYHVVPFGLLQLGTSCLKRRGYFVAVNVATVAGDALFGRRFGPPATPGIWLERARKKVSPTAIIIPNASERRRFALLHTR